MSSQSRLRVILGTMEMGRGALTDDSPVSSDAVIVSPLLCEIMFLVHSVTN